ncbi:MAG TPA: ATP-binding protein [Candidatus Thermoplasmatota archaeon]|nr:ATP-binding protein [Candidatus Thermoplasmatota archaeon]
MDTPIVGAVFGNVSTTEFRFAVRDATLKRLDYVQVEHPTDGALVAQVTEVTRETNMGFEEAGRRYGDQPLRDQLIGRARVIGFRDLAGRLQAPRTPVPAGAEVRRVDSALLAQVFGLRDTEGAYLGVVKGYDLRVVLDINTLVQKHVSILAKTGSGKSYVVGVLMEELIKRHVPVVVVDPHGEHGSLAKPNNSPHDQAARRRFGVTPRNYGEHIVEYSPDTVANPDAAPFVLESKNLEVRDVVELLGGEVTNSQMGILHAAVRELKDKGKDYDLTVLLDTVRESASNAKWTLVSALESLVSLGIFTGVGTSIESLVQPKKVSILNLKGVSPEVQQTVVTLMSRRLFEARKLGKVPPFMLVMEECHNFAPEKGMATTASGMALRTIASEGRKFGMGLMVVSQRPAKVDKNVLSQCNTQIILKVTNPNDLKALASSVEGLTGDSEDEIQRLPVGVAFVSHPRISIPVLVEVRPRETAHGGESVDVMAAVRDAEEAEEEEAIAAVEKELGIPAAADEDEDEDKDEGREKTRAKAKGADATPKRAQQKRLPDPEPETEAAPEPPPRPLPAPARAPGPAPNRRLHATWLDELAQEVRFVSSSDLASLDRARLSALESELSERAQTLSHDVHELGPRGEELLAQLNAQLVRVHGLLGSTKKGFFARWLRP